jgi:hypothetical protein
MPRGNDGRHGSTERPSRRDRSGESGSAEFSLGFQSPEGFPICRIITTAIIDTAVRFGRPTDAAVQLAEPETAVGLK